MIEILNQQKIRKIRLNRIIKCIKDVCVFLGVSSKKISIVFCDNKFIKKLNKKFFKKNSPTDIICFPLQDKLEPDYLGEIIVSVQEALNQAKKYNNSFEEELIYYIIHGILHLLGYRDDTNREYKIMERKQEEIFKKIKI